MEIAEGLKKIENGWVRKPEGFRVKYQKLVDGQMETGYSPPKDSTPLESDVTAWRYAWKLAQTCQPDSAPPQDGDLANILVVDDQGVRIRSYITGDYDVYLPKKGPRENECRNT